MKLLSGGVKALSGGSLDYQAYAVETADSSPDENYSKRGVMVAFVYTDKAEEVMNWSYDARRRVIIDEMVDRFGIEATHPLLYEETYWTEETWTRGCYGAYLQPNATTNMAPQFELLSVPYIGRARKLSDFWPTFIEEPWRARNEP